MSGRRAPLRGAILVGGRSSRMGRPKALVLHRGRALAERAYDAVAPCVASVVLAGQGPVPASLAALELVPDAPGVAGPLAALVALAERDPGAAWLVCACDLPLVSREACAWLVGQRAPGAIAIVPCPDGGRPEPMLALYEPAVRGALSALVASGGAGPSRLAEREDVATPEPPPALAVAWRDVDTPAELSALDVDEDDPRT